MYTALWKTWANRETTRCSPIQVHLQNVSRHPYSKLIHTIFLPPFLYAHFLFIFYIFFTFCSLFLSLSLFFHGKIHSKPEITSCVQTTHSQWARSLYICRQRAYNNTPFCFPGFFSLSPFLAKTLLSSWSSSRLFSSSFLCPLLACMSVCLTVCVIVREKRACLLLARLQFSSSGGWWRLVLAVVHCVLSAWVSYC